METVQKYIKTNQKRFLDELIEFLRIPSISADTKYQGDVLKAATWLSTELKRIGMEGVEIIPTKGHPVVFAEKKVSDQVPTILVYGHYDVQPVDPLNLWDSPPFEPVVRDEGTATRPPEMAPTGAGAASFAASLVTRSSFFSLLAPATPWAARPKRPFSTTPT
ncbi:MAG: hypothetical protein ABJB16_15595, partial [Saprospiraceae bacterium]